MSEENKCQKCGDMFMGPGIVCGSKCEISMIEGLRAQLLEREKELEEARKNLSEPQWRLLKEIESLQASDELQRLEIACKTKALEVAREALGYMDMRFKGTHPDPRHCYIRSTAAKEVVERAISRMGAILSGQEKGGGDANQA